MSVNKDRPADRSTRLIQLLNLLDERARDALDRQDFVRLPILDGRFVLVEDALVEAWSTKTP